MVNVRILKPLLWLGISLVMVLTLWLVPVDASTALLTSRINQIESTVRILRTQVTQLQSRIARGDNVPATVSPPIEPIALGGDPSLEAQFDNLAILVIELRDRIIELETKVAELEP